MFFCVSIASRRRFDFWISIHKYSTVDMLTVTVKPLFLWNIIIKLARRSAAVAHWQEPEQTVTVANVWSVCHMSHPLHCQWLHKLSKSLTHYNGRSWMSLVCWVFVDLPVLTKTPLCIADGRPGVLFACHEFHDSDSESSTWCYGCRVREKKNAHTRKL